MLAYLDCFSGISGDMLLGALVHAGLACRPWREQLDRLGLDHVLDMAPVCIQGLAATRVRVEGGASPPRRHLSEIRALLDQAALPASAKERSLRVFERLAGAEARVHGATPEQVHFHEVGAVDAIIDVVGAVLGLELLGVERIVCSPLPMARGWTHCAHGDLPLPGPAVWELLRDAPVYGVELEQELVTPTGAALLMGLGAVFGPMPPLRIRALGYGAGSRERADGRPNLLRLVLGEEVLVAESQEVEVTETSLDDWNPEIWPHVAEKLLAAGALDLALSSSMGKKGRPGFQLRVVCDPAHGHALRRVLLSETSAIGLRHRRESRETLPRRTGQVETPWGQVAVKIVDSPDGPRSSPEYEDCRRLAEAAGVSIQRIYAAALREPPCIT